MGLDWNPLGRPKKGHEAEHAQLFREMHEGVPSKNLFGKTKLRKLTKKEQEQRIARFKGVCEAPFEALGAPRVGLDAAADEWLRSTLDDGADFERARESMKGYYVLDLLPECDGFPRFTHHGMYEGVDRYSFRGSFLNDVKEIVGEDLHSRAFVTMNAEQLAEYADALAAKAMPWAKEHSVAHLAKEGSHGDDEEGSPEWKADILFSAIRWCRYWSKLGFGLEPWF